MASTRSSAAHASVLFLRVPGLARQPVPEQARLKSQLEAVLTSSIAELGDDERIVLEAAEGMAVVVLANPAAALALAWRAQSRHREPTLAIGLTHGPVRVSEDGPDALVLHGDGVAAAEMVSTFARDGAVAITREFHDALARAAPGIARNLPSAYGSVDAGDRSFELVHATESSLDARRRRFLAIAAAACVAIIALGGLARWLVSGEPPPPPPPPPGTVTFDIKPAGDIWVNGAQKGSTPPLKSIQLPPGTHSLEIRHGNFPPLLSPLTIAPGEEVAIAHTFVAPKAAPTPKQPAKQPQQPAWRRYWDKWKP